MLKILETVQLLERAVLLQKMYIHAALFLGIHQKRRVRFSPWVIDALEKTKWWELSKEVLIMRINDLNQITQTTSI